MCHVLLLTQARVSVSGVKTSLPPRPSLRESHLSYSERCPEDRISYCTGPIETPKHFGFSDSPLSYNSVRDVKPTDRPSSAPHRHASTPMTSSSVTISREGTEQWRQRHWQAKSSSNKIVQSLFGDSSGMGEDPKRNSHSILSQPQSSRFYTRHTGKHEAVSSRHRRASNKPSLEIGKDGNNASEVEMEFIQKLHRTHRPKTAIGLQSISTSHRGIGRVGLQVSINDCVCIASSADLGTATDTKTEQTGNKRHVFTWASRVPSEPRLTKTETQAPQLDSGSQVDVLGTPQSKGSAQPCQCSCVCETPPQSAADYYHAMQSRQTGTAESGERNNQNSNLPFGSGYGSAHGAAYGSANGAAYGTATDSAHGGPNGAAFGPAYGMAYGGANATASGAANGRPYGTAYNAGYGASYGFDPRGGGQLPGISLGEGKGDPARQNKNGVYSSRYRKKRRESLRDWQDPHKLYPDPLSWGGERPYRWEDNLRNAETNALIVVHPQRWMPVGKQQYSHRHGYPSWPTAITSMIMPWSPPTSFCGIPQPCQPMLCCPDSQFGSSLTCYPTPLQSCCPKNDSPYSGLRQSCPC